MKRKYTALALLLAGCVLLGVSLVLSIITVANKNIIGGADLPTFIFVFFQEHGGAYFALALSGVLCVLAACIILVRKEKR